MTSGRGFCSGVPQPFAAASHHKIAAKRGSSEPVRQKRTLPDGPERSLIACRQTCP
jgi:hypothetical protein